MPMEVQTELLEADSDQVTAAIMTQEMEPSQDATAETARENRRDAEGLETKPTVDSQVESQEMRTEHLCQF